MKTTKFFKVIAGAAVVGVICGAFIYRATRPKQIAEAEVLPVVELTQAETRDIVNTTSVIGSIEPSDMVYVTSKASGDVTAVNVQAGQTVEKGQVLCTIDTKQVETAKSSLDSAQVDLQKANDDLTRQTTLYQSGDISAEEYEQYKNTQQSAQIKYNEAKYNYETQLEYSQVTAAISGVVESCDVEVHDSVSAGTQLMVISGGGSKTVSFYTTERICGYLNTGDSISVEKDGQSYNAVIYEISTMADSTSGLFKVKASVDGGDSLPTGTKAKIVVTSSSAEDTLAVPQDAVYYDDGQPYVYTVDDSNILHLTQITTGIMDDEYIQVTGGLDGSEKIVKTWTSELDDGAEVRVADEEEQG